MASARELLILSQVYVPDPASVGQHMADAAVEMVRRGWRVNVLTSNRGYDDPSTEFPRHEIIDGVEVHRLPLSSFGKRSISRRLVGGMSFVAQTTLRGLLSRRLDHILVSTSPPMCGASALAVSLARGTPVTYWVMDLNPDQMIALGRVAEDSLPARLFDAFNHMILGRARQVVALDRFMAERLKRKRDIGDKLTILPPWPHEDHLELVRHEDNPFRARHGLHAKTVIMYSGNHALGTPLTTVLEAARRLRHRDDLVFMFVGGGVGKKEVDQFIAEHNVHNARSLPYQPLAEIKYSLSAADVHLVAVGDDVVGISHPCKVYGAMAVARPILLLGPNPCHVSEIIERDRIGWRIAHGDVDGAVKTIEGIGDAAREQLDEMGRRARQVTLDRFSKQSLLGQFCDVLERSSLSSAVGEAA